MDANSLKDLYDEKFPSGDFLQYISDFTGIEVPRLSYIQPDNLILVDPPEEVALRSVGWTMQGELIDAMVNDLNGSL